MEIALEAGADDIQTLDDGSVEVTTSPDAFGAVSEAFEKAELKPDNAEVTMVASTEVELNLDQAQKFMKLSDVLEDLDDVQNVYHNASISDDVAEQL
jgi:transcriptional/translational regulatory protein YebC/TACO1